MPFDDNDLKRLKMLNDKDMNKHIISLYTVSDIHFLLARLEATTVCAKHLEVHDDLSPIEREDIRKWKQSAGLSNNDSGTK